MGCRKGVPHRKYTQDEKVGYVQQCLAQNKSSYQFAKENNLARGTLQRWITVYTQEGVAGLASHTNRRGNPYAALHRSKSLSETERIELRLAKLETDVARLKKGYVVKGSGSRKEFVTTSGKSFKSSKN